MRLQAGQKAPFFEGLDQDGKVIKLSDFEGKKLVLYFYPKDDTPTCTTQACNLRDNYKALINAGYAVLGVSINNPKSHLKFIKKYNLPFPLLADVDLKVNEMYGVWQEKLLFGRKYMGTARTTFVIDEKGMITEIIDKVESAHHSDQIIK